jgi:hypothetical protein
MEANNTELIITEFEMNEQVFVPAGDGDPARWKRKADLLPDEGFRHAQGVHEAAVQFGIRVDRHRALLDESIRRATGLDDVPMGALLTEEEMDEFSSLHLAIEAQNRVIERREAAIDRDIAIRRYWVIGRNQ